MSHHEMPAASTFILPRFADLPESDIALNRLIAFSNRFDPTALLKRLWAGAFAEKASETWLSHWHGFQAGQPAPASAMTLLFTLNYDIVSGANLYRRETPGPSFHQWLVSGLRRTTRPPAAARAEHRFNHREAIHAERDTVAA